MYIKIHTEILFRHYNIQLRNILRRTPFVLRNYFCALILKITARDAY